MSVVDRAYHAGMFALVLGWSFVFGQYALTAPRMPRLSASPTVLVSGAPPKVIPWADSVILCCGIVMCWWAYATNEWVAATLASWAPYAAFLGYVAVMLGTIAAIWRMPKISTVLGRKEAPTMLVAAGIVIILIYGAMAYFADGANNGGVTLEAWMLHTGVWGCATGGFGIGMAIWKRRNPGRASFGWSRPDKMIHTRLCSQGIHLGSQYIDQGSQDANVAYRSPWPGRIKGLYGCR